MKNKKILIISLLLLIFMIGAVNAADGNTMLAGDDSGYYHDDSPVIIDDDGPVVIDDDVVVIDDDVVVIDDDPVVIDDDGPVVIDDDPVVIDDDDPYVDPNEGKSIIAEDMYVFFKSKSNTVFEATFTNFEHQTLPMNTPVTIIVNGIEHNLTTFMIFGSASADLSDCNLGDNEIICINPVTGQNATFIVHVIDAIEANNVSMNVSDEVNFTAKIFDYGGQPFISYGYITFTIYNETNEMVKEFLPRPDENGIVSFPIDLDVGKYTLKTKMANSDVSYDYSFGIEVLPVINETANSPTPASGNASDANATGNGTNVTSGNASDANATGNGTNVTSGNSTGDNSTNVTKIATKISATSVNMVYDSGKAMTVTLKDKDGNPIANAKITIAINGKPYYKTTDSKGKAKLTITLSPKTYKATIKFAGNVQYIDSQTTATVKVTKATSKITANKKTFKAKTKTKKYTFALKYNKNKAIKKVTVRLKVKGVTYKATTNSKGKATFKITKLFKTGKYTAKIIFAGNGNFKAATKSVKITIK